MLTIFHLFAVSSAIALVISVKVLRAKNYQKTAFIFHQLLRLIYIFILVTGLILLSYVTNTLSVFKIFLGICSIAVIEVYLIPTANPTYQKLSTYFFIGMVGFTILLGLCLPLGLYLFG
ncbi:DUF1516 family protein [Priestia megaterium]|nr:DUF1516 family protein [Priestia megaterium]